MYVIIIGTTLCVHYEYQLFLLNNSTSGWFKGSFLNKFWDIHR